jgi:hypothetical protein
MVGTELAAYGVSALAEGSTGSNVALVISNTVAILRGGSFVANGAWAVGIENYGASASLDAEAVTVLAEYTGDTTEAAGLQNKEGADATVRRGSFTARGAYYARGILNDSSGTTLSVEGAIVVGESCAYACYGLVNQDDASAELHNGSFLGDGPEYGTGVANEDGSALRAVATAAKGEAGATYSVGFYSIGSTDSQIAHCRLEGATHSVYDGGAGITVTHSLLIGGPTSGLVHCLLVVRGGDVSDDVPPYDCP